MNVYLKYITLNTAISLLFLSGYAKVSNTGTVFDILYVVTSPLSFVSYFVIQNHVMIIEKRLATMVIASRYNWLNLHDIIRYPFIVFLK